MLFELRGACAVHRPVTGVVRAHGQLVDHESAVSRLEEFDGHRADNTELGRDAQRQLFGFLGNGTRKGGSRCDHDGALAVALNRLDDRPRSALAERRPRDHGGQFPTHRDHFLDDQRNTLVQLLGDNGFCFVLIVGDPDSAAVVASASCLDDKRPTVLRTETHDVFCPRHFGVRRYGRAQFGKFATHQQFVLSEDQSLRRRLNVHAFGNKNLEDAPWARARGQTSTRWNRPLRGEERRGRCGCRARRRG